MLHYLKLMLQLILSPTKGWEDIASGADSPRRTLTHGLAPLAAAAGLSSFVCLFYFDAPPFGVVFLQAVAETITYVITYFLGVTVMTYAMQWMSSLPEGGRQRVELFCAYSTGIMALVGVLEGLLPMELTLLQFLPLYVIVVMCCARDFLGVDEKHIFRLAGAGTVSIVVPVYVIDMLMRSAI